MNKNYDLEDKIFDNSNYGKNIDTEENGIEVILEDIKKSPNITESGTEKLVENNFYDTKKCVKVNKYRLKK